MSTEISLKDRFGYMAWMRQFELTCLQGVPTREIHGELHTGVGQEAISAAMVGFLTKRMRFVARIEITSTQLQKA